MYLKFDLEFKYAQLHKFLKIKLGTCSICKYEKLKLRYFYEIYFTVHDGKIVGEMMLLILNRGL